MIFPSRSGWRGGGDNTEVNKVYCESNWTALHLFGSNIRKAGKFFKSRPNICKLTSCRQDIRKCGRNKIFSCSGEFPIYIGGKKSGKVGNNNASIPERVQENGMINKTGVACGLTPKTFACFLRKPFLLLLAAEIWGACDKAPRELDPYDHHTTLTLNPLQSASITWLNLSNFSLFWFF